MINAIQVYKNHVKEATSQKHLVTTYVRVKEGDDIKTFLNQMESIRKKEDIFPIPSGSILYPLVLRTRYGFIHIGSSFI